jgi:transcriptional regulator with XRE-family HTH domain
MSPRNEIREFLTSRRARITPELAGLPFYGTNRRVSGLRREEVALLAGISVEYYTRLERGNATGVSDGVLDGLATALQLDDAERAHLIHLVRRAGPPVPARRQPARQHVRPAVQRVLDAITDSPAFVRNARLDILAANRLGEAFYSELFADPTRPVNTARFLFLNPRASEFFVDWDSVTNDAVGVLRAEAGRDPYDSRLSELIGELSTRSAEFRIRWAAHDVKRQSTGVKRFRHPLVGELTLDFESLDLRADPGLSVLVYSAEPDSPTRERLDLLASWTAPPTEPSTNLEHR